MRALPANSIAARTPAKTQASRSSSDPNIDSKVSIIILSDDARAPDTGRLATSSASRRNAPSPRAVHLHGVPSTSGQGHPVENSRLSRNRCIGESPIAAGICGIGNDGLPVDRGKEAGRRLEDVGLSRRAGQ